MIERKGCGGGRYVERGESNVVTQRSCSCQTQHFKLYEVFRENFCGTQFGDRSTHLRWNFENSRKKNGALDHGPVWT